MMKTIIIAVCSAVAYLAIVIGLTVYCSIRLLRAKNIRMCQSEAAPGEENPLNQAFLMLSDQTICLENFGLRTNWRLICPTYSMSRHWTGLPFKLISKEMLLKFQSTVTLNAS